MLKPSVGVIAVGSWNRNPNSRLYVFNIVVFPAFAGPTNKILISLRRQWALYNPESKVNINDVLYCCRHRSAYILIQAITHIES